MVQIHRNHNKRLFFSGQYRAPHLLSSVDGERYFAAAPKERSVIQVDFEVTNRCNAKCEFCPRDATPHQGLMSPEVFDASLARTVDYRAQVQQWVKEGIWYDDDPSVQISLCGLGEPLLHRHLISYLEKSKAEGFHTSISSNGSVLTPKKTEQLLTAGMDRIYLNIADEGEKYEEIYHLPYEKTRKYVEHFVKEAKGTDTEVWLVLVDYLGDPEHIKRMTAYWNERGINAIMPIEIMNRGGALFVDEMQYPTYPEVAHAQNMFAEKSIDPLCGAPFAFLFIGYDGLYYLCCSDWRKQASLGSVFDESLGSIIKPKLDYVRTREPVCKNCNLDPANRLADALRDVAEGVESESHIEAVFADIADSSARMSRSLTAIDRQFPDHVSAPKKLIPLNVL